MPTLDGTIEILQGLNLSFVEFIGTLVGGPHNALVLLFAIAKIALILGHVLGIIPLIIWAERKIIGFVQDRPGPNRVGPFGLLQGIADGAKLLMKEDFIPAGADRTLYLMAPGLVLVPAFLAMCIIPFGPVIEGAALFDLYRILGIESLWMQSSSLPLAVSNPNIGVLFVFAITSVAVYGITLAGWSSENKWSLLGGIRASAQMISYEITLSLSIIGVLLIAGSLNLFEIVNGQDGPLWILHWNVFAQPVACLLFIIAMFAETNRLPFDLAEGEAELTGGFHTEYSSMKFALFFLAEYANMITASAVCATLFFGGYLLIPTEMAVAAIGAVLGWIEGLQSGFRFLPGVPVILASFMAPLGLILKIAVFIVIFIMARAVWPRLRYDQVMNLGWKIMLPIGLVNLTLTAVGVALLSAWGAARVAGAAPEIVEASIAETINNYKWLIGLVTFVLLVILDRGYAMRRRKMLGATYRNFGAGRPRQSGAVAS